MNITIHELKTVQPYFDKVWTNQKQFECRKNDRDFKLGDILILQEFDPISKTYSGRQVKRTVSYVLSDDFEGISKGYCILSF